MIRLASQRMQIGLSSSRHLGALVATILLMQLASSPAKGSYDPEQQDGIPVFSARSVSKPLDEWGAGEQSPSQAPYAQRRQADSDLDDGLEDEDEDEYKSGSAPQESIENPSYGESQRAARDGEEIEDFFDKHLGPPHEATAADESSASVSHQQVPAIDPDTDDQYEAAASSPLSTIFHSLLSHSHGDHKHKRPFLQIATSSSADSDSDGSKDKNSDSSSSSSPRGSMKTSQSAQSYVEATPVTLALTPMTEAPSQVVGQDSNGQEVAQDQQEAGPTLSGVREIYIGRRPTVMSYLQQTHAHQQAQVPPGYTTAGSNHVWRGPTGRQVAYEHSQSNDAYARHRIAPASYAYQREQANMAGAASAPSAADDEQTVTYGLSFGGSPAEEGSSGAGDDGGQSLDSQGQDDQSAASPEPNEQAYQQEQPQAYEPYNTRYSTSSTRAHNNYHGNPTANPAGLYYRQAYMRVVPQQQQVMVQPKSSYQHYSRGGSIKYHRDPSESANTVAMRPAMPEQQQYYAGYRQVGQSRLYSTTDGDDEQANDYGSGQSNQAKAQKLAERQQLLAALDREIKASPHYRNNNAAAAASSNFERQHSKPMDRRQHLMTMKKVKKSYKGDDLDSFNSYHSEVDPYRTFTSTSRMIDDPTSSLMANSRQVPIQSSSDPNLTADSSYNGVGNSAYMSHSSSGDNQQKQQATTNFLTGPLTNFDQTGRMSPSNGLDTNSQSSGQNVPNSRVRREDADEREIDNDVEDDGVWVDDDEDDDNRQQSSDVNETSQDPQDEEEEDSGQQDAANNVPIAQHQMNPPGVIGGPHGYELSPNDLMVYHG